MIVIETCPNCGYELTELCIATFPPKYQKHCFNCGWESEVEQEKVVYQPYETK